MKKFKGFILGFITCALLTTAVYAQQIEVLFNSINIAVNGEIVKADNVLYDGRTYVPLRAIAEMIGMEVTWDNETKTAGLKNMTTMPAPKPITKIENSRTNPAGIGKAIVCEREDFISGKNKLQITLIEVIRGQKAWEIAYKENKLNNPPKEGMEYVLAKFNVKILETEDDKPIDINDSLFDEVKANGSVYNNGFYSLVIPNELSTELYQGAEHEGYTYFLIEKDDMPLARFKLKHNLYAWFDLNIAN